MKNETDFSGISDWQLNALQWMELCKLAMRERDDARRERDQTIQTMEEEIRELRREVCWLDSMRTCDSVLEPRRTPQEIAEERGWDCFKETR